jgi:hypothetical protein
LWETELKGSDEGVVAGTGPGIGVLRVGQIFVSIGCDRNACRYLSSWVQIENWQYWKGENRKVDTYIIWWWAYIWAYRESQVRACGSLLHGKYCSYIRSSHTVSGQYMDYMHITNSSEIISF